MYTKSRRDDKFLQEKRISSFSSSLLDEIFRSIDSGEPERDDPRYYERNKKLGHGGGGDKDKAAAMKYSAIQRYEEEEVDDRKRRLSLPEFVRSRSKHRDRDSPFLLDSSSSSSGSSFGGFSSSEADSVPNFNLQKLRPVRTSAVFAHSENRGREEKPLFQKQRDPKKSDSHKNEDYFFEPKGRVSKIDIDLRSAKQPVSPGARIAAFINSFFTARNAKKTTKRASSASIGDYVDSNNSNCSSASSLSRSCLSKASPSSRVKSRNGVKRSVRFYPVSVIVDEDSRPCGHKCLYGEDSDNSIRTIGRMVSSDRDAELRSKASEKSRRTREVLRSVHQVERRNQVVKNSKEDEDEDDDDGAGSCSSSDLFELDHLGSIGKGRYCEELPVYETTRLDANRWLHR